MPGMNATPGGSDRGKTQGNILIIPPSPTSQLKSLTLLQAQWLLQQAPLILSSNYPQIAILSYNESLSRVDPSWGRTAAVWEEVVRRLGGVGGLGRMFERLGRTPVFGRVGVPGDEMLGAGGERRGGAEGRGGGEVRMHVPSAVGGDACDSAVVRSGVVAPAGEGPQRQQKAKSKLKTKEKEQPAPPADKKIKPFPLPAPIPAKRQKHPWTAEQFKWLLSHEPLLQTSDWHSLAALMQNKAMQRQDPTWARTTSSIQTQLSVWKGVKGLQAHVMRLEGRMERDVKCRAGVEAPLKFSRGIAGREITRKRKNKEEHAVAVKKPAWNARPPKKVVQPVSDENPEFNLEEQFYLLRYHRRDIENKNWKSITHVLQTKADESSSYRRWTLEQVVLGMTVAMRVGGWYYEKRGKKARDGEMVKLVREEEEVAAVL